MKFEASLSGQKIQTRIREMAKEIAEHYNSDFPYLVAIANGGCFPGVDLSRALFDIGIDTEIAFPNLSTYEDSQKPTKDPVFQADFYKLPLRGRHVLFIEDILDTGKTITYAIGEARRQGAKSVAAAFLFAKPAEILKVPYKPDFVGFHIPARWAKGNGLDTRGLGRGDRRLLLKIE